jgi:hypothetical protein
MARAKSTTMAVDEDGMSKCRFSNAGRMKGANEPKERDARSLVEGGGGRLLAGRIGPWAWAMEIFVWAQCHVRTEQRQRQAKAVSPTGRAGTGHGLRETESGRRVTGWRTATGYRPLNRVSSGQSLGQLVPLEGQQTCSQADTRCAQHCRLDARWVNRPPEVLLCPRSRRRICQQKAQRYQDFQSQLLARYFGGFVSALHPDSNQLLHVSHACQARLAKSTPKEEGKEGLVCRLPRLITTLQAWHQHRCAIPRI